jgi:D-alanyl-D-alanine carboxypeptidase/D-alanyl-D-alanine-endopeptidase (penicillin-binding protein 4)
MVLADGSGLSRRNHLTPRLLTSLLTSLNDNRDTGVGAALIDALPIAGVDGTLADRLKGTAAESRVRATTPHEQLP